MEDNKATRRTDAHRHGDQLDGILAYMKIAKQKETIVETEDYPEQVLETLRLFVKLWGIPSGAIPTKKNKSRFSQWIKELTELNKLSPSHMKEDMEHAFETWAGMKTQFIVSHPLAIRSVLVDAVSYRRRREEIEKEKREKEELLGKDIRERMKEEEEKSTVTADRFKQLRRGQNE